MLTQISTEGCKKGGENTICSWIWSSKRRKILQCCALCGPSAMRYLEVSVGEIMCTVYLWCCLFHASPPRIDHVYCVLIRMCMSLVCSVCVLHARTFLCAATQHMKHKQRNGTEAISPESGLAGRDCWQCAECGSRNSLRNFPLDCKHRGTDYCPNGNFFLWRCPTAGCQHVFDVRPKNPNDGRMIDTVPAEGYQCPGACARHT